MLYFMVNLRFCAFEITLTFHRIPGGQEPKSILLQDAFESSLNNSESLVRRTFECEMVL